MNPNVPGQSYSGTRPAEGASVGDADGSLLVRIAAGDEQALGEFYDRWEHWVRSVVARKVVDPMNAEDVVEAVFWQVWRQADRYDATRGDVRTWLATIARSRALDRQRQASRSRDDTSLDALVADGASLVAESADGTPADDPLALLELAERGERVRDAVRSLPAEQRETLELAYFAGLSQREIALRTATPLGTVKTRSRLALAKLRELLRDVLLDDAGGVT